MSLHQFQKDPAAFREWLKIERADGTVAPLGSCFAPHQAGCFSAVDPALLKLVNPKAPTPKFSRCWWERCRGGSKTQDASVIALWLLFASRRPLHGAVVACDQEQAAIVADTLRRLLRINPALAQAVEVQRWQAVNPYTNSTLRILAADERSSYGLLLDYALCDEVSLWPSDAMWTSITSTLGKRPNTLLVVCGNAGWKDSWCWPIRQFVSTDPHWHFHEMTSSPTWIGEEQLAEQRLLLPPAAFRRLWQGEWVDSLGDCFDPQDIAACFDPDAVPMDRREGDDWIYIAGVDLADVKDRAACVILAAPVDRPDKIRLARARLWKAEPNGRIDTLSILNWLIEMDERFSLDRVVVESFGSSNLLAQELEIYTTHRRRSQRKLRCVGPWVEVVRQTSLSVQQQSALLLDHITSRRFRFYDYVPLRNDLLRARAEEKATGGFRIKSPRTREGGHGDTLSALMVALPHAHEAVTKPKRVTLGVFGQGDDEGESPSQAYARHLAEMWRRDREDLARYSERDIAMMMPTQPGAFAPRPPPRNAPRPTGFPTVRESNY